MQSDEQASFLHDQPAYLQASVAIRISARVLIWVHPEPCRLLPMANSTCLHVNKLFEYAPAHITCRLRFDKQPISQRPNIESTSMLSETLPFALRTSLSSCLFRVIG